MKIKKKIWGCLLSLLCIFMLVLPVMASESPETDSEVSAVTSEESAVPTEYPAYSGRTVSNHCLWMMLVF